jgi:hypothetical protein
MIWLAAHQRCVIPFQTWKERGVHLCRQRLDAELNRASLAHLILYDG